MTLFHLLIAGRRLTHLRCDGPPRSGPAVVVGAVGGGRYAGTVPGQYNQGGPTCPAGKSGKAAASGSQL